MAAVVVTIFLRRFGVVGVWAACGSSSGNGVGVVGWLLSMVVYPFRVSSGCKAGVVIAGAIGCGWFLSDTYDIQGRNTAGGWGNLACRVVCFAAGPVCGWAGGGWLWPGLSGGQFLFTFRVWFCLPGAVWFGVLLVVLGGLWFRVGFLPWWRGRLLRWFLFWRFLVSLLFLVGFVGLALER